MIISSKTCSLNRKKQTLALTGSGQSTVAVFQAYGRYQSQLFKDDGVDQDSVAFVEKHRAVHSSDHQEPQVHHLFLLLSRLRSQLHVLDCFYFAVLDEEESIGSQRLLRRLPFAEQQQVIKVACHKSVVEVG